MSTACERALLRGVASQLFRKFRRNSMNFAHTGHGIVSDLSCQCVRLALMRTELTCCAALGLLRTPSMAALYRSAALGSLSSADSPADSSAEVDSASASRSRRTFCDRCGVSCRLLCLGGVDRSCL